MSRKGLEVVSTFDLGGCTEYIVGHRELGETNYYKFLASKQEDILNYFANMFDSSTYLTKERGLVRLFILNKPEAIVYFINN